jgi:hypothetical protein
MIPVISILSARYEAVDGAGGVDVTDKVAKMVRDGATSIEATNANFGDPTNLHVKRLRIVYKLDGKQVEKTVEENEYLELAGDGSDLSTPVYEITTSRTGLNILAWNAGTFSGSISSGTTASRFSGIRASAPRTAPIAGPWKVSFPPNLGAPASITLDSLISWPDSSDPGIKYFSGSATYQTTVDAPANLFSANHAIYLNLGTVKNIAEVWLNGASLGTLWKPPFRIDVTGHIKPGHNTLRVRVTNLWPNRIIGDEQLPSDVEWNGDVIKAWPQWLIDGKPRPPSQRITFTTWRVFSKDSPLYPAGLIGPVELISVERIKLTH